MYGVGPFFMMCMEKVRAKLERLAWAMHECSDYRDVNELPILIFICFGHCFSAL